MRRREHGLTLEEKISEHSQKVLNKNVIKHINDSFFAPFEEAGQIYFLRRTNL